MAVFLSPLPENASLGTNWQISESYGWVILDFGVDFVASLIAIQNIYFGMKNVFTSTFIHF
jgi:hypothetical protein